MIEFKKSLKRYPEDFIVYNESCTDWTCISLSTDNNFIIDALLNGRYARTAGDLQFVSKSKSEICRFKSYIGYFFYDNGDIHFKNLFGDEFSVAGNDILIPLTDFKRRVRELWGER